MADPASKELSLAQVRLICNAAESFPDGYELGTESDALILSVVNLGLLIPVGDGDDENAVRLTQPGIRYMVARHGWKWEGGVLSAPATQGDLHPEPRAVPAPRASRSRGKRKKGGLVDQALGCFYLLVLAVIVIIVLAIFNR